MAVDPVTGIADALTMLLSVINKTMDLIPDYSQRKKEEFHNLRTKYENEKKRDCDTRDDNALGIYRDRILLFAASFDIELQQQKVPTLQ